MSYMEFMSSIGIVLDELEKIGMTIRPARDNCATYHKLNIIDIDVFFLSESMSVCYCVDYTKIDNEWEHFLFTDENWIKNLLNFINSLILPVKDL